MNRNNFSHDDFKEEEEVGIKLEQFVIEWGVDVSNKEETSN